MLVEAPYLTAPCGPFNRHRAAFVQKQKLAKDLKQIQQRAHMEFLVGQIYLVSSSTAIDEVASQSLMSDDPMLSFAAGCRR